MHQTVQNLLNINTQIKTKINELKYNNYKAEIIAISKTFSISHILPLIDYGHIHFGENKVKEAIEKQKRRKQMLKDISQYGILIILAITVAVVTVTLVIKLFGKGL